MEPAGRMQRPCLAGSLRWAGFALSVRGLGLGVGEFAIMGLLPDVVGGFGISIPQTGHAISSYAHGVVVGAPAIAVLAARMARRTLLLALMTASILGNIATALAPCRVRAIMQ